MFERIPRSIFLALILILAPVAKAQNAQNPITTDKSADMMRQMSASFENLVKRVSPAVVEVQVTGFGSTDDDDEDNDNDSKSSTGRQRSLGSGVVVDPDGYIITNYHVVKGAQRVRVVLTPTTAGDSQVRASLGLGEHSPPPDARIIGIAPTIDLALLKIEQKNLPSM